MAAALEWEAKANLPEPSHQGSCIPGITSCDGVCMDRANVFNMTEADWLRLADEKLRK
jgi:hypothetical protein